MSISLTNIELTQVKGEGFNLPPGFSWHPSLVRGKKEGKVEVFDNDGALYAELQYKADKLDGMCKFYQEGELQEIVSYKKDIPSGWNTVFADGVEVRSFYYDNGRRSSQIEKVGDFWKIVDESNSNDYTLCKFDDHHRKVGIGYRYVNNILSEAIMYKNDETDYHCGTFKGNEMTEVDRNGDVIYKGEFLNEVNECFPRHGKGKEYKGSKLCYTGDWQYNMKEGEGKSLKNGRALYIGEWKNNLPNGKGKLMNANGEKVYEGNWKDGMIELEGGKKYSYESETVIESSSERVVEKPVEHGECALITCFREWESLSKTVGKIRFPSLCCNEESFNELILYNYMNLEELVIGPGCCKNVKLFIVDGCERLTRISIGKKSFGFKEGIIIKKDDKSSFHLVGCHSLTELVIDAGSFIPYTGFELTDLPNLKTLTIGSMSEASINFAYSNFSLKGLIFRILLQ